MSYDPELWLESLVREIKAYAESNFNDTYQVVMEFPGPMLDRSELPLSKTVIHFEIDDILDSLIGIGDNAFADNYDSTAHTVNPQYARQHRVNFDVGVWASAKSGGVTSRLRAKQTLEEMFGAVNGQLNLRAASDGGDGYIEVISYTGGRMIMDTINDSPVYRMIDTALVVRVFSLTKLAVTAGPAIEEIIQDPNLEIIGPPTGDLIILG